MFLTTTCHLCPKLSQKKILLPWWRQNHLASMEWVWPIISIKTMKHWKLRFSAKKHASHWEEGIFVRVGDFTMVHAELFWTLFSEKGKIQTMGTNHCMLWSSSLTTLARHGTKTIPKQSQFQLRLLIANTSAVPDISCHFAWLMHVPYTNSKVYRQDPSTTTKSRIFMMS